MKEDDIDIHKENEPIGQTMPEDGTENADKPDAKDKDSDDALDAREEMKRLINEIEQEDELPIGAAVTLNKILGGEFLTIRSLRKHIKFIALIMFFIILYVSNRYSCDKQRIQISALTKELEETKFKAMSSTSDLTRVSRESNVLNMLKQNKDSVLHIPSQPPYIINVLEQ